VCNTNIAWVVVSVVVSLLMIKYVVQCSVHSIFMKKQRKDQ